MINIDGQAPAPAIVGYALFAINIVFIKTTLNDGTEFNVYCGFSVCVC